jgi:hypothetical protein
MRPPIDAIVFSDEPVRSCSGYARDTRSWANKTKCSSAEVNPEQCRGDQALRAQPA